MTSIKNEKDINVYKGVIFKQAPKKQKKIITVDLDETLGSFSHLHILWKGIMRLSGKRGDETLSIFLNYLICIPNF